MDSTLNEKKKKKKKKKNNRAPRVKPGRALFPL